MPLLPFFKWCDTTFLANWVRDSQYIFPALEGVHILALAVLLGTVITVALRLLGKGLTGQTVPEVYRQLSRMRNGGLCVIVATGIPLFCSEAMKAYENPPFWFKMESLAVAILFQYTVVRWAATRETPVRWRDGLVGILSLVFWFSVGVGGRAIGFY